MAGTDPLTGLFRYSYNANSRLITRWTPGSGGGGLTTQYSYDAAGNLTKMDYPSSSDVTLQYDAGNRLTNMLDAAGTTRYAYTSFGALQSEDGPWTSDTVSYGYDNARRRNGLSLAQPNAGAWAQSYLHDSLGRLTNVVSPAGAFGYTLHHPTINPDDGAPQSGGTPMAGTTTHWLLLPGGANVTNIFDVDGRLLSTSLLDSGRNVLNAHSYQYSDAGLRTRQTRTEGSYVNYGYDDAGQLTSASGAESGGSGRLHEQFSYTYDAAGNLTNRNNYALQQEFRVNSLNELTSASRSGTYTVAGGAQGSPSSVTVNGVAASLYADKSFAKDGLSLNDGTNTFIAVATDSYGRWDTNKVTVNLPATVTFTYDLNGNLRTNGTRLLDYDDENQLIRVTEPGAWKSEFVYDGKMRRRVRKEYLWQSGTWALAQEVRYVYDGNLVIQERTSMNLPQVTYTRGRDLSGSLEGAGGIGGLLARTDHSTLNPQLSTAFYHADGNGNVTMLVNASQQVVARYLYDPYGNTVAATGPLAESNLYRFSSKELHLASGLVYYLYRFFDPGMQRWLNCDPIMEQGGVNLYAFIENNSQNLIDSDGLAWWPPNKWPFVIGPPPPPTFTPCSNPQNIAACVNICFLQNRAFGSCTVITTTILLPFGFWEQTTVISCHCSTVRACPFLPY